jgi:beta-phosphoglucomutase-like phosphatase (HAD superfamily)
MNAPSIPSTPSPSSFPVRAIVFDFDGLVLDTETPVYQAWAEAFEAHGVAHMAERARTLVGVG